MRNLGIGLVMIGHAELEYDYAGGTIPGLVRVFEESGVPLPVVAGPANMFGELLGGVAMIIGLEVPLVGFLMALTMMGAWVFVHAGYGFFDPQGPGLVVTIGLLSLVLPVSGSRRLGLDHLISGRSRRTAEPRPEEVHGSVSSARHAMTHQEKLGVVAMRLRSDLRVSTQNRRSYL